MKIISLFGLVALLIGAVSSRLLNPSSDELIDYINSSQNLWRAGQTFSRNKRSVPESLREVNGTNENTTFNDTSPGNNYNTSVPLPEVNETNENTTFSGTSPGYNYSISLPLPVVNGTNENTSFSGTSPGYNYSTSLPLPEVNGTNENTTFNGTSPGYNYSISLPLPVVNGTNENTSFSGTSPGYNYSTSLPLPEVNGTNENTTFNGTLSKYNNRSLPSHFDARDKWKNCSSLFNIRNQGSCWSGWAMAAVSAMSDRLCISSNGNENVHLSELDVMTCCMDCGSPCGGGMLQNAWKYAFRQGVVSGGDNGCKPYTIPGCQYSTSGANLPTCIPKTQKLVCKHQCQAGFLKPYRSDRRRLRSIYKLTNVKSMMSNILKYGPITTNIQVFQDFLQYRSGVYKHVTGAMIGLQSVKLFGWGEEENGVKYWLAANSWGRNWGDNGFFKILRGANHLDVEKDAYAGVFRKFKHS